MGTAPFAPGPANHLVQFSLYGSEPWRALDLTAITQEQPISGSPSGRRDSSSIFVRGGSGGDHLIEYHKDNVGIWTSADLTDLSGGHHIVGDPVANANGTSVFACDENDHLVQFFLAAGGEWEWYDLTDRTQGRQIKNSPTLDKGERGVWACDPDGRLVEFYIDDNGDWSWWPVSEMAGGPSVASRPSLPAGGDVFARADGNYLVEFGTMSNGDWGSSPFTGSTIWPTIAGDPCATSPRRVFARTTDQHLVLYWSPWDWKLADLTEQCDGHLIASNPVASDDRSVFANDPDGHLVNFYLNDAGDWVWTDISDMVGARTTGDPSLGPDGTILATADVFDVHGAIRETWQAHGWESGVLGYPTADQSPTDPPVGQWCAFQNDSAVIWHPDHGAFPVRDRILRFYEELGGTTSDLSFPVAEQTQNADGWGWTQLFEHGAIYDNPSLPNAAALVGAINDAYVNMGAEHGALGYPVSPFAVDGPTGGLVAYCQHGAVVSRSDIGTLGVYGATYERWHQSGGLSSDLGYPVSDEHDRPDGSGREQLFENGRIIYNIHDGAQSDPVFLNGTVTSGALETLSGWVQLRLYFDGTVRWTGHIHDGGIESYAYTLTAFTESAAPIRVAGAHAGVVTPGAGRDDVWDDTSTNPLVVKYWSQLQDSMLIVSQSHQGNIGAPLVEIFDAVAHMALASVVDAGSLLLTVMVGVDFTAAISNQPQAVGRAVEGFLWCAGPERTLLAVYLDKMANTGTQTRPMTDPEFELADRVFRGTLPRDRIVLTDTIGLGGRGFTLPTDGGRLIGVNLGPEVYADPTDSSIVQNTQDAPSIFIHELTHAWQIAHLPQLTYLAGALGTLGEDSAYAYDDDPTALLSTPWQNYNIEQQAMIVEDWYAQHPDDLDGAGATGDARYRFIEGNIRAGVD